jgi:hypothetical protein
VAFSLADLLIVAVFVGAGCALTYVSLRRSFRRAVSELQLGTERQMHALTNTLKAVEARVAELRTGPSQAGAIQSAAVLASAPVAAMAAVTPTAKAGTAPPAEEIEPEMLVVMAAAVTAFLGKKVRIRSAKMLQSPYEIVNPWSQQGRVFVQASHNLRSRG